MSNDFPTETRKTKRVRLFTEFVSRGLAAYVPLLTGRTRKTVGREAADRACSNALMQRCPQGQFSPPTTKGLYDESEGGRGVPPIRIIEMITAERRTPVLQHANEFAACQTILNLVFWHVGQPETAERGVPPHGKIIEDELAVDPDPQLAAVLFELPGEDGVVCGQPHVNAVVCGQVLRRLRTLVLAEVYGRAHHRHPYVGADRNSDHVLGDLFSKPHAGVEPFSDDVCQTVVDDGGPSIAARRHALVFSVGKRRRQQTIAAIYASFMHERLPSQKLQLDQRLVICFYAKDRLQ